MIEVENLTKIYGKRTAIESVTFEARAGRVTGLLGPNGAGKSTTMRILLGLDRATSGRASVLGSEYRSLRRPLTRVGAQFDGSGAHRGRTARAHLRWMATSNGISPTRIPETLRLVGLSDVADRRVGTFSLGMGQRLGIAAALLGDPEVVILDEPMNGLDPEGIRWIRDLARSLAGSGRTVLISSHLMGEMQSMADDLVVMARGTVIRAGAATSLVAEHDSLEHAYFAWTQGRAEHVAGDAA
ncbi:ATP-binding cassette domain-containing protein [Pseudoclavibacter sp. Marseille-Q4354]|nr:ATP-binding cassette domain-containing protein [Pseudoclavibacter sp. Marseille-Q4354]